MKTTKILTLLAMMVVTVGVCSAEVVEKHVKTDAEKTVKSYYTKNGDELKLFKQIVLPKRIDKHDIRLGVGSLGLFSYLLLNDSYYDYDMIQPGFGSQLAEADTYRTPRWFVGNYTLSYVYHDRRWLQYGGLVSFGASTCRTRHAVTGKTLENHNMYMFGVMPMVRFVWYWREKVQLYSSVAFGVMMTDFDYEVFPWGDVTLIGCSFGRKFFGFAELGGGMSGVLRVGMGYRFDAAGKNKK